jgi:hypothetical protein
MKSVTQAALPSLLILALAGCDGEISQPETDGGIQCEASSASGDWLMHFGPISHDVHTDGGKATASVILYRKGAGDTLVGISGKAISFKIITQGGDAKMQSPTVTSDQDGLASAIFESGKIAQKYQVEASVPGTCAVYFTVEVRKPLLQLRAVTPSPFDTFTNSRVPIAVEATTDGNARLADRDISFTFKLGSSGETKLSEPTGGPEGPTLKVKTNNVGRATAMLATGSQAIPQLVVVATMAGTAPAELTVRVATGQNKGCKDDWDCPLGYTCKSSACQAPPTTPPTGCTTDGDCAPPTICQVATGKCLEKTGNACDPIEGTGCPPDEVCIGQYCAKVPTGCADNSACPSGWVCVSGKCQPAGKQPGGCNTNNDCPTGNACINGVCKPKTACNIPHAADRLKGVWKFDSTLHFRDALSGVLSVLLKTGGVLRDIIEGRFKISGIPSFISSIVSKYLKSLIGKYVPPWGQQLIIVLGDLNDIVDDMRVMSTVQTTSVGNDAYVNSEQWDIVEFTYKGQKISSPPNAIPQIGTVKIKNYGSYEVCGVYLINKHQVNNAVGGIVKWAINTALSVVTCKVQSIPCFGSIDQALQQVINCQMLGMQLDQMVMSIWPSAPSVANLVAQGCNAEKQKLIKMINDELNKLTTKLSLLELSGTANIQNQHNLPAGTWNGVLGSGIAKGNFKGEFKAVKQP